MSNLLTAEIKDLFSKSNKGLTLLITVGNDLRGDDGVGPYIYERTAEKGFLDSKPRFYLLNAFDKPENIIDEAVKLAPSKVIIIDAADFGGEAGEARIIEKENIPQTTLSTHTFPLPVIAKILEEDTGAEVFFLGIQPQNIELGNGLSDAVKKTAKEIISCMKSIY
ncbi:hydrogenase maturation peptidase HycI [candidate division WOR-1 bacterium RIFOXYD2_FULL_36_8]|uniref:Hydrogenase maturation peptidase HycI n=1 Tax=candidate division WOR-1 bacterium RIFOXYB2_FULL_36_35 TaxID=1802578 RepID=A0A1F4S8G4_UNCSA|nr:MAG: hydrogenase maturation peptidase HycI [candidate division WOR-1 bacterium RIFOXYA2_FULL_36_21]OGC16001.1 MAG: hydrogenase maturation peptidase HycI [candidate division WOR-1 bacterium RIFOXYA12_FULL_36_13]OGC16716.1 MAG: hydrogenase maturation peptidase HycI [candidate division WOR-1 bacterium RIFOXYB2_FULL_36_35]OGC39345.1 MAG: hydrogenase maturation peptidase HycI [candidate division WOR-1 bacterium RIFOXYD2_FULL_36_8]